MVWKIRLKDLKKYLINNMKILGIGVDIVENSRIAKSLKSNFFIKRIFSNSEILNANKIKDKKSYYAKRFAAKEAFSKALGTGIANGINFNEIVVLNEKNGKPFITLEGMTKKKINKKFKKKIKISLSLSDEKKYAVAFVAITLWVKKKSLL